MFKKFQQQKGFSLVEVLVSMAIFVTFTSIMINSYSSIVQSQRDANSYRLMYVEARHVFEMLTQEFRDGMIDYGKTTRIGGDLLRGQQDVWLLSKDGLTKTRIFWENGVLKITKGKVNDPNEDPVGAFTLDLNTEAVRISNFAIYVTPPVDPYDTKFVSYDINQFHPKVTFYAVFERQGRGERVYSFDLQTSISSRVYNQAYQIKEL